MSFVLAPLVISRASEYLVHFRSSPLRAVTEIGVSAVVFGTLFTEALGINAWSALFPGLTSYQRLAIATPLAALSAFSLSRGMSPSHGPVKRMDGKVALLTGATNGIGLELARELATQGANLVLVARNATRAEEVAQELRAINSKIEVSVLVADQADLAAVSRLNISRNAPAFSHGIDLLVLNAGAFPENVATFNSDGYEESLASMHLSHTIIAKMSWNLLNKDARVVVSSSISQDICPSVDTVFEGLKDQSGTLAINKNGYARYGRAKFANALFARQLGRIADKDSRKITVVSFHPGAVATNIWCSPTAPRLLTLLVNGICAALMRSIKKGTATLIDASIGVHPMKGQETAPNGSYYISSTLVDHGYRFNPLLHSAPAAHQFWELTEQTIAPFCPSSASWDIVAQ